MAEKINKKYAFGLALFFSSLLVLYFFTLVLNSNNAIFTNFIDARPDLKKVNDPEVTAFASVGSSILSLNYSLSILLLGFLMVVIGLQVVQLNLIKAYSQRVLKKPRVIVRKRV